MGKTSNDVYEAGQRLYYALSADRVSRLGPLQFTNHCCDLTVYTKSIDGVRCRIARRDIHAGEAVTSHYSINARGGGARECACGSAKLRRLDELLEDEHSFLRVPGYPELHLLIVYPHR